MVHQSKGWLLTSYTDKAGVVEATTYDVYGRGLVNSVTEAYGTAVAASTVYTYDKGAWGQFT